MKTYSVNVGSNVLFNVLVEAVNSHDAHEVAREFVNLELKKIIPANSNSQVIAVDFRNKYFSSAEVLNISSKSTGTCKLLQFVK